MCSSPPLDGCLLIRGTFQSELNFHTRWSTQLKSNVFLIDLWERDDIDGIKSPFGCSTMWGRGYSVPLAPLSMAREMPLPTTLPSFLLYALRSTDPTRNLSVIIYLKSYSPLKSRSIESDHGAVVASESHDKVRALGSSLSLSGLRKSHSSNVPLLLYALWHGVVVCRWYHHDMVVGCWCTTSQLVPKSMHWLFEPLLLGNRILDLPLFSSVYVVRTNIHYPCPILLRQFRNNTLTPPPLSFLFITANEINMMSVHHSLQSGPAAFVVPLYVGTLPQRLSMCKVPIWECHIL